ncbi:type II toxin-antitoxin system PemK/MazF family toxin [Pusillimonas sp. MFBS29]|uniref:type II toxin-antitoxin system PemK/MazF family toxin n=1 Tax=Pusillimonas sp. MFBS29 TaxID=2886690 RepID=UPI001D0F6006|nr:type II toxin-antitoxin system PemK/MazF family toxin [Pusillimonas sp. MFBS29]MCC2595871.1 type II toxin-antitoxin system PemK/MazF family toxin [Pusillimonas sp. MFBS29]
MRGDLVMIAMQGDFGKPRPALVIQSDLFSTHPTVSILPITSTLVDAPLLQVTIHPNANNGLRKPSQIMIDKSMTVKRDKVSAPIGKLDDNTMVEVDRRLVLFLGIAR